MLDEAEGGDDTPVIALSELNFGPLLTMSNGRCRLDTRFAGDTAHIEQLKGRIGQPLGAAEALRRGLVTFAPDELDWDDELRLAVEERAALSPDALTGLEASLRFGGAETMDTKIFGRLSAWQNWIFNRPNAVGEKGALKVFGSGSKAQFDWERV
jgi:benzoyl-CoA-dihydrodiol lyase